MSEFPRFFVPTASQASHVTLAGDEAHHLTRVLRLGPGDGVGLFDGMGGEWIGYVRSVAPEVTVEIVDRATAAAEPPVRITLGVGLLKGSQMDTVVRDATMMGAFAIAPMTSQHVSIARRAWQSGASVQRWQRVALASARQCGRAVVPVIAPVASLESTLEETVTDAVLMCVEPAALCGDVSPSAGPRPQTALVLVGPEGGWASEEVHRAVSRGVRLVSLGPRTLRAEAVPAVLLSSLWTQWGW